jgi:hypothetical protein
MVGGTVLTAVLVPPCAAQVRVPVDVMAETALNNNRPSIPAVGGPVTATPVPMLLTVLVTETVPAGV